MKNLRFLVVFIFFMVYPCFDTLACVCPTISSEEDEILRRVKYGSAVFSGEVLTIVATGKHRNVTFQVNEFWKGKVTSKFTVATDHLTSSCSYDFEIGKKYLVFSSLWNGNNHTSACSRNRELEKAGRELSILGKGKLPAPPYVKK